MNRRKSTLFKAISFALVSGTSLSVFAASAQEVDFNIPAEPATESLPEYARQADVQIVAPADGLSGVRTAELKGRQDARAALQRLLAGTGLKVVRDDGRVITLSQEVQENTTVPVGQDLSLIHISFGLQVLLMTGYAS